MSACVQETTSTVRKLYGHIHKICVILDSSKVFDNVSNLVMFNKHRNLLLIYYKQVDMIIIRVASINILEVVK